MKKSLVKFNNEGIFNNTNNINQSPLIIRGPLGFEKGGDIHFVLIGIMLGDGSLYRSSPTANVRFEMSFGENYKDFALELGDLFGKYMSNPIKALEVKGKTKTYINYRLKTKSLPVFVEYFNIFYKFNEDLNKNIKIVPSNIGELMNPIVLAYLIMTDGNFDKGRNRVRIYTNNYTKEEVELLAKAIKDNLNIYTGVLHDRNNQ
jgi:hypothetical protein